MSEAWPKPEDLRIDRGVLNWPVHYGDYPDIADPCDEIDFGLAVWLMQECREERAVKRRREAGEFTPVTYSFRRVA